MLVGSVGIPKHTFNHNSYDLPQTKISPGIFSSATNRRGRLDARAAAVEQSGVLVHIEYRGATMTAPIHFPPGDHRRAGTLDICLHQIDCTNSGKHTPLHNQKLPCYY